MPRRARAKNAAAAPRTEVLAVFCYGTLRADYSPSGDRWGVVQEFDARWQVCTVRGFRLFQQDGSFYPLAVKTGHDGDILVGTLLQFPDKRTATSAIGRCDSVEGFSPQRRTDGLYQREVVEVQLPEGSVLAYVYHQPMPEAPVRHFPGGDWLELDGPRQPEAQPVGDPMAALMAGGRRRATFGFGSNSVRQLRGRVGDQSLRGYPARVAGQVLAFAGPNRTWAHGEDAAPGGTATLVPRRGSVALGTVAFLEEEQLWQLDRYEGVPHVYDRREFAAEVLVGGEWRRTAAIAYIKQDSAEWYPPSEAYCCAVLRNVRGSFPAVRSLELRDCSGKLRGEWWHPGPAGLGLGAFLFELGVRKREPWRLPRDIGLAKDRLAGAGIAGTVAALARALDPGTALDASRAFDREELAIAGRLLADAGEDGESSDDDAQAERSPWSERERTGRPCPRGDHVEPRRSLPRPGPAPDAAPPRGIPSGA